MLKYKFNIIEALNDIGINSTVARNTGVFAQATMKKFKDGDTSISLDNLNRLCCLLEMQPRDIIKFVETEEDREKILAKVSKTKM